MKERGKNQISVVCCKQGQRNTLVVERDKKNKEKKKPESKGFVLQMVFFLKHETLKWINVKKTLINSWE